MTSKKELRLPQYSYGPITLKILQEFIEHHKLSSDLKRPDNADTIESAISKILNIMISSMGNEKKDQIIQEVLEYNSSLPKKS